MINFLPAVLVGGPPHAGKSVLFYRLTQALRERGVDHYALRACPDGEGNWFHEGDPDLMSNLRVKLTGPWPLAFIQSISQALKHRCLPFLVDMGGSPKASDAWLLRACTHSILLRLASSPEESQSWQNLTEAHGLLPLAQLTSEQTGSSFITASSPVLNGVIAGLERSTASAGAGAGPVFDALLTRLSALFTSYDLQEVKARHCELAPTELVIDVQQELREFTTTSPSWQPAMIAALIAGLPEQVPLSVYGSGPGWLYAALAAYEHPQSFFLFDPKLPFGWIAPAHVRLGVEASHSDVMEVEATLNEDFTLLKIRFPEDRLQYLQPDPLIFPPVPLERGLIIDGRTPNWLLTALTRCYQTAGVAWIASFYPQLAKAVVVFSRVDMLRPGDLVCRS